MPEERSAEPMLRNGGALAALVAAAIGCTAMGVLYAVAGAVPAVGRALTWYAPAGALSGMGGGMVLIWLTAWAGLHRSWSARTLPTRPVLAAAFGLLLLGILLTFPPVARLL